ncbi:MAG: VCBS repeat-containing protein [Thermoflexales bacterium]|nr:VCBS repeat-containing protein [Thermoflexales bacterium]
MKNQYLIVLVLLTGLSLLPGAVWEAGASRAATFGAPALKWQHGGCYSSWCETGWYSSPAVADLDGDAVPEVIGGLYKIFILNGENGSLWKGIDTPGSRVWPGVVVADIDDDGELEIVTAQGDAYLNVLDHNGEQVWSLQAGSNELRGLSVYDLDNDKTLEIVVTAARGDEINTWVYEHDGKLRAGWPQLSNDSGYAWGVFNDNAAVGDLDGDGQGEIVVPSDVHYICVYEADGVQIPANAMYGSKAWGKVGVWEDLSVERRGWGECNGVRAESYRTNFADGPAVIADVNGDGKMEVVATGNVYDCHAGYPPSRYVGVYVFNADRSRFNAGSYDWRTVPVDTGAPVSEDYNVIESATYNPVTADLDGDGYLEILFSSYDGRLHAYWLDKTEHGNWPFSVYPGSGALRFATEPVVADLDDDGLAEVIFASWVQKDSNQTGQLYILNHLGDLIYSVDLPAAFGSPNWNGALAAPTLADIDGDPDLEVVLNTAHSGFVAYDLPGTANARVLWGTGRGNYQRTGSFLQGWLRAPQVRVNSPTAHPGDTLAYTIRLENSGAALPSVSVTNTLPAELSYRGDLWASSGSYGEAGGVITWRGAVEGGRPVSITYSALVYAGLSGPAALVNRVRIDDGQGNVEERSAVTIVDGFSIYLPLIWRN